MDFHIERPTLNARTAEENLAKVDTWIADTADKLNLMTTSQNMGSGSASFVSDMSELKSALFLGSYKIETEELNLGE